MINRIVLIMQRQRISQPLWIWRVKKRAQRFTNAIVF
jgi:hypothetical protein